ncbi:MAG TPA: permease-like cell division protein FtsX [Polyangiales bacterium]|nr:permease-like cell division protein FtsX [Polyangiales bacterium]
MVSAHAHDRRDRHMNLQAILQRTQRGFRNDLRLHAVAVVSLIVAFLCLGTALLGIENLSRIAERWSQTQHLTVYLRADASPEAVAQLRTSLAGLREISKVEYVSAAQARELFLQQTSLGAEPSVLGDDVFPASLEVDLTAHLAPERLEKLAQGISQFPAAEEIETYRSFIGQFHTLLEVGRTGAWGLSLLVLICVLAVIGNTIRLAVLNRKAEIEVLKLCGATDAFVRSPFLVEGILQAVMSASLAMVLLLFAYLLLRGRVETTLTAFTGVSSVFLSPLTVAALIAAAGTLGGLGSAWSLRRYLKV